jgi:hypothetical protein
MGAKPSRPKRRARSPSCGYYKNQRDAYQREKDIYKNRSNYYSRLYNKAQKKAIEIQSELNLLREQAGNPQKHKEKAKELFHHLEKRYLDRLSLISTQQNLLDRQNVLISTKGKKIKENKKKLDKQLDKIDTSTRQINYDMDENIDKNYFIKYLKLCFLIVGILIIGLLIREYKK